MKIIGSQGKVKKLKIFTEETITIPEVLGENLYNQLLNNLKLYTPSKHLKILSLVKDLKKKNKKVIIWGYFTDSIKRLNFSLYICIHNNIGIIFTIVMFFSTTFLVCAQRSVICSFEFVTYITENSLVFIV